MAEIVVDLNRLHAQAGSIPGAKPPVSELPYKDFGHPEEVHQFRTVIREIRRQVPLRAQ